MQISTVFSDLGILISSIFATILIARQNSRAADETTRGNGALVVTLAIFCFSTMALAALLGMFRFSGMEIVLGFNIIRLHIAVTEFAAEAGLPSLALAFLLSGASLFQVFALPLAVLLAVVALSIPESTKELYGIVVDALALVLIIIVVIRTVPSKTKVLIAAVVAYVASGLIVGVKGEMFGIKRIDIFHYLLVVGNLCFGFLLCSVINLRRRTP